MKEININNNIESKKNMGKNSFKKKKFFRKKFYKKKTK